MPVAEQNDLRVITDDQQNNVLMRFVGTAENQDAMFLGELLEAAREKYSSRPLIILDFTECQFCFSECIKSLMQFITWSSERPPVEVRINKRITWQITSLRALARMGSRTTVVECEPPPKPQPEPSVVSTVSSTVDNSASPAQDPAATATATATAAAAPCEPTLEGGFCMHDETDTREEHFFAPTGNGSIVTEVYCKSCGVVLSKTSEYYD